MPPKGQFQDMERVNIQITAEAKRQILEWAAASNVKPGYFMSMALTVGARALARQLNPEHFMPAAAWDAIVRSWAASPEMMALLGAAGAAELQEAVDSPDKMQEVLAKLTDEVVVE